MNPWYTINSWLMVGNKDACHTAPAQCCIHINRSDHPENDCQRKRHELDLEMNYHDGCLLDPSNLTNLQEFCKWIGTRTVLVHCHAGACRSPIVAAYVLAQYSSIDSIDLFTAVAMISRARWQQWRDVPNITYRPLFQFAQLLHK